MKGEEEMERWMEQTVTGEGQRDVLVLKYVDV